MWARWFLLLNMSLPVRERGLKSDLSVASYLSFLSLPVRERGLKSYNTRIDDIAQESLPVRERGLKFVVDACISAVFRRSPCGSVD